MQRASPPTFVHPSDHDAVRLHVEQAADGLHVWIGADGGGVPVPARAAAIVAELRRSEYVRATAMASVVFNGHILYASGRPVASALEISR